MRVLPFCEGTLSGDAYTSNKTYIREGLSYYDPLVYSNVGGYRRYYLYDGLGSTRQLLNDAQNTTDTYSYEAFGNSMGSTGTTSNPYKYVGSLGYYQTGSSLQHLGLRYYMPEIGRFTTPDPLGMEDNAYTYVGAAPTVHADPGGLAWWPWKPKPKPKPKPPVTIGPAPKPPPPTIGPAPNDGPPCPDDGKRPPWRPHWPDWLPKPDPRVVGLCAVACDVNCMGLPAWPPYYEGCWGTCMLECVFIGP